MLIKSWEIYSDQYSRTFYESDKLIVTNKFYLLT